MAASYLQRLRLFSREVRLYLIVSVLIGFSIEGIRAVLFNLYLLRLGYGPTGIGWINAAGALGFALFSLPAGALGTHWGSRRMLIAGVALLAVGNGMLPLASVMPTAWRTGWVLATTGVASLGVSLYWVNGLPFLMSATAPSERSHAFAVHVALSPLAGFAGSLIGGALPGSFAAMLGLSPDHPTAYGYPLTLAAALLLPGVLALWATRGSEAQQTEERVAEAGRAPHGLMALLALIVLFRLAGRGAVTAFFNVYLDAELNAPTRLIGTLSAAAQVVSVPAALVTPLLVARWGNSRIIFWGSLGLALSMLPLALIPHLGGAGVALMGMTALFSVTTAPFRVYSQEVVSPAWRPAMSAALIMAVGLSNGAMAVGGGYIVAALGYRSLFLAAAGLATVGAVLFWACFGALRGRAGHVESAARRSDQ